MEAGDLSRVVRHQLNAPDAEDLQHLRRRFVVPWVCREPEGLVRLHGVEALVLEVIRGDLVREPDPATLLREVQEHTPGRASDSPQRRPQLFPAIAPQRGERVPRETLGMKPHEDVLLSSDPAFRDRDVFSASVRSRKAVDPEVPVPRRKLSGVRESESFPRESHAAVSDEGTLLEGSPDTRIQ